MKVLQDETGVNNYMYFYVRRLRKLKKKFDSLKSYFTLKIRMRKPRKVNRRYVYEVAYTTCTPTNSLLNFGGRRKKFKTTSGKELVEYPCSYCPHFEDDPRHPGVKICNKYGYTREFVPFSRLVEIPGLKSRYPDAKNVILPDEKKFVWEHARVYFIG